MAGNTISARLRLLMAEIAEQSAITRRLIDNCLELLSAPAPDTFLGRKTQEPFPGQGVKTRPDLDPAQGDADAVQDLPRR